MSNLDTVGKIWVYDDEFTFSQRLFLFEFILKSKFIIGGVDSEIPESPTPNLPFLISEWSAEDLERCKILDHIHSVDLYNKIGNRNLRRCLVNLDFSREIHHPHTHRNNDVLIYQANMEWRPEWYGETLFYDDKVEEILYANQYTPGRLIYFDGTVPHMFRPPSRSAPYYRFTLSMFFDKKE